MEAVHPAHSLALGSDRHRYAPTPARMAKFQAGVLAPRHRPDRSSDSGFYAPLPLPPPPAPDAIFVPLGFFAHGKFANSCTRPHRAATRPKPLTSRVQTHSCQSQYGCFSKNTHTSIYPAAVCCNFNADSISTATMRDTPCSCMVTPTS